LEGYSDISFYENLDMSIPALAKMVPTENGRYGSNFDTISIE